MSMKFVKAVAEALATVMGRWGAPIRGWLRYVDQSQTNRIEHATKEAVLADGRIEDVLSELRVENQTLKNNISDGFREVLQIIQTDPLLKSVLRDQYEAGATYEEMAKSIEDRVRNESTRLTEAGILTDQAIDALLRAALAKTNYTGIRELWNDIQDTEFNRLDFPFATPTLQDGYSRFVDAFWKQPSTVWLKTIACLLNRHQRVEEFHILDKHIRFLVEQRVWKPGTPGSQGQENGHV